ncbi:hypothetical protein AO284_08315 [Pseudomonas sp. NZIPFR-PS2]|nr:hypothetical protein AO284_08315 [Pseudomonas sp. NZIPFR-PS2]
MRGRVQATLVVAGCAALPLLYWLGAAAGCLVLLRRGLQDAIGVLALGVVAALIWWLQLGEPKVLLVLLGSSSLALVLRASESWVRTLLVSVALGLVFSVLIDAAFRPQIEALSQEIVKILPMALGEIGLMAVMMQIVSLLSLMLGRYWQALLYNPGGFGREFRSIRIPVGPAMLLLALMVVGPYFGSHAALLVLFCSVPLVFSGLALMHGLVAQKRLAKFWLVGMYVTMLVFMQLIYPLLVVLAIVDGLIDFRGRLAPKDADNANGEG